MAKTQEKKAKPSVTSITKHLQGIDFPVKKKDLIEHANKKGVDDAVMQMFNEMDDREYNSIKDVMKEYGDKYEKAA
jgi:hypothetical protein